MTPRTALVVDDDAASRRLVVRLLERNGWQVLQAADGEAALACLSAVALDLVVLDLRMPGTIDGLHLASYLRDNPAHRRVPILGVSASPQDIFRQRAFAAGCHAFVSKPINLKRLLAEIERLTQAKELR